MKKYCIRILSTVLAVTLLLTAAPLSGFVGLEWPEIDLGAVFAPKAEAVETVASGTCGENLTWVLDSEGTLVISGTGLMSTDWGSEGSPWYTRRFIIKKIIIDYGVTSIDDRAFEWLGNVTSVSIPSSVTSIGSDVFYRCSSLTSLVIPDSVESIGSYAFSYCSGLTSFTLPPKITSIPTGTFSHNSSMQSIVIPDGVTEIGSYAFASCTSLQSITLPEKLTSIGGEAFDSCKKLTSLHIPENVTTIGNKAFIYCSGIEEITFADSIQLESINFYTFGYCSSLQTVRIPDSVSAITEGAFANCTSLETVKFGKNSKLTSINRSAFENCTALESINLEACAQLQYIYKYAFYKCSSLTSVRLPDSLISIGEYTFADCTLLSDVDLGNGIQYISSYAFYKMPLLQTIHFPASLSSIGGSTFVYCDSLQSVTVDAGNNYFCSEDGILFSKDKTMLYIYPCAKQGTAFTIPDSVERICGYAFFNCTQLTEITVPDSVNFVGAYAFSGCAALTAIAIPDGVTKINGNTFYGCSSLTEIAIPDSVTGIDEYAFCDCTGLERIVIPATVKNIYSGAFYNCPNLSDVYYTGSAEEWTTIYISSKNDPFKTAARHYNYVPTSSNGNVTKIGQTKVKSLLIAPRNTEGWLSGTVGNESLVEKSGKLHWKLSAATAKIGGKTFEQDDRKDIKIEQGDITDDIILSREDFYNYIIPKAVAVSFINAGLTNVYEFTAYMKKEVKNGKPYISTVFAKQENTDGTFIDIRRDNLTVADNVSYIFYITPDNLDEGATYYISQDEAHKVESSTGCFSIDYLSTVLENGKTTYAYFVTDSGVVSDAVEIKLNFENPQDNDIVKELSKGKLNIGGEEGLSITLPEDWILIGGSTIDLNDWSFPVGVQIDGNAVRVSVGFDWWTRTSTTKTSYSSIDKQTQHEYISQNTEYKTSTLWENIKSGIKGCGNAFKNATDKAEAVRIKKQLCSRYGVDVQDLANSRVGKTKTNVSSLGYIEGSIINGKFIVTDMYISVAGEFTMSYTIQLSQGYLGLEGGGKLTVATNWSRATADLNLPLEFGFSVNFTPEIKARGGIGWDGLASAGVYGKGTMPTLITFKDNKLSISLTGEFGYEAQVLVWSTGEKALLNGTFGPKEFFFGKSSVERARTLQAHGLCAEDVGLAQTAYTLTERKQSSDWLGDDRLLPNNGIYTPNRVGVSSAEELTFKTLQQDVFELSETKIITAGDTTVAAWVTEEETRDDYNRLLLVYSVYDAITDTWSEPKAVYDDGFTDASPALATDGEKIFVAWQKYCKTFTAENSANISDVLAAAEIYVAEYDIPNDTFVNATRITDDNVYDYRTALTVKDGEAVVAYATANHNALMAAAGNSITKVESGNKTVLAQSISTVNNLACAVIDNEVEIAYSADTDGNLQTTEDISVFCGSETFAQFPKFYADDPLTNLVFANFNGRMTLFVSDGLNIYYSKNSEVVAVLEEETVISSQLQAINETEGLSFWWISSEENGNELYTCSNIDGEWSNAIRLSDRANELSCLAVTVADNQVIGIANETLVSFDETTQVSTKGATNFLFFRENDCFDLAMCSVGLDETALQVGETAFLEVTAENVGNIKADELTFTVTDTNGTEKEYLVDTLLLPGKSVFWQIPYVVPENMAETTVTVTISCNAQSDSVPGNNTATCDFSKAALVAKANNAANVDNIYILTADVSNMNFVAAQDVKATAVFNDTTATPVSTVNVGNLNKEELAVVEFAFTETELSFDEDGICIVYVTISAANAESVVCAYTIRKTSADYLLGDIDNDGKITSADARTALRAAVGLDTLTEEQTLAADVNKDGAVTSTDARSILRCAVGLENF